MHTQHFSCQQATTRLTDRHLYCRWRIGWILKRQNSVKINFIFFLNFIPATLTQHNTTIITIFIYNTKIKGIYNFICCLGVSIGSSFCKDALHTYIQTYIHTYIRTYVHTYIHTYIHTYVHTYIQTYIHTYVHTYVHTYIHTYIHTYVRTYIHTYIHTYTNIHT